MDENDLRKNMKDSTLGFTFNHINDSLFESILHGINPVAKLYRWRRSDMDTCNSIMARLTSEDDEVQTFVGHIGFKVQYHLPGDGDEDFHAKQVVLKAKPPGNETITMISNVTRSINKELSEVFEQFKSKIGFSDTDYRELEMYRITEASVRSIQPWIYHTIIDEDKKIFAYVMENFVSEGFTHLNTVDDVSVWKEEDILDVLRDVSGMHAVFYGQTSDIPGHVSKWLTPTNLVELAPLWQVFLEHNKSLWKTKVPAEISEVLQMAIINIKEVDNLIQMSPNTLVHNDFNVRNMCLRPDTKDGKKRLVLYDWELTAIAPPQRDVAEFLAFVLPPDTDASLWQHYVNHYLGFIKTEIIRVHGSVPERFCSSLQSENFMKVFDMFVVEMLLNRVSMYGLAYSVHRLSFGGRVVRSLGSYLQQVRNAYCFLANPQK